MLRMLFGVDERLEAFVIFSSQTLNNEFAPSQTYIRVATHKSASTSLVRDTSTL